MSPLNLSPDDPRLTAYALGELEGEERAQVEAAVRDDPLLRQAVAEIQSLSGELTEALAAEAVPVATHPSPPTRSKIVRFPYYWTAGLAAAGFAVLVAVRQEDSPVRTQTVVYELNLGKSSAGAATAEVGAPSATESDVAAPPLPASESEPFASKIAPTPLQLGERSLRDEFGNPALGAGAASPAPVVSQPELAQRTKSIQAAVTTWNPESTPVAVSGEFNREQYSPIEENRFLGAGPHPLSTFGIDVDTASYANVRRLLGHGQRPPRDAVRIEELVNYFPYDYSAPTGSTEAPFAADLEVAGAPWAPSHRLVRIGLKARGLAPAERKPANLVFLLDVSGSMAEPNKLPLVKDAMLQLVAQLQPDDRVAIVTYAGASGLALASTPVRQVREIRAALASLAPGGSTNGAMGIHLAYDIAKANFIPDGINRVILCTDGDFNVGVTAAGDLTQLVAEKARTGVFLTALGFGMGNYRDDMLERLADRGNGNYGYIDSAREARKLLVEQVDGTLATVAKDVKVQVEFNPARVRAYRLIGYENRALRSEDFNNDAVDAGEIGAGHTVTALYEIIPAGGAWPDAPQVDELKYQETTATPSPAAEGSELLTVKVRYKLPHGEASERAEFPLVDDGRDFASASGDFRFAAAVAGFGMALRESEHRGDANLPRVLEWANGAIGTDAGGYRREFIDLVRRAIEVVGS